MIGIVILNLKDSRSFYIGVETWCSAKLGSWLITLKERESSVSNVIDCK